MKMNFRNIALSAFALLAVGCTIDYIEPDQSKLPQASALTPIITVDQETNYVTFSIADKGVVPMWIFGDEKVDGKTSKKYAYTQNGVTLRIRDAGTHTVELKAYNANGISQGSQLVTFTLDNTYRDPFDPTKYNNAIVGKWEWNSTVDGHFGCGSEISSPLNWWSCSANGKAGYLYDDRFEFTSDGKYIYTSEDGMAYANTGSEYYSEYNTEDADYLFPVESGVEKTFAFEREWNDAGIEEIYLTLESGSIFSYVPHKSFVEEPRLLVMENSPSKMKNKLQLACFVKTPNNTDGIAWYYELIPEGSADSGDDEGDDEEYDDWCKEIWDPAKVSYTYWYSASDWSGALKPEISEIDGGYSVVIPDGIGGSEWMGQTHFTLDAPMYASKTYNFSVKLNSSADCVATVKLAMEGDDTAHAVFYDGNVQLSADEDVVYAQYHIKPDVDYEKVALFVDLGRTPAGETVKITDISLGEIIEGDDAWSDDNVTVTYWYSASDWSGALKPDIEKIDGGWSVVIPDGIGGSEWMGQTHFTLNNAIYASKKYNFQITLKSSEDCTATVKLAMEGDDTNHAAFYDGNVQLSANEAYTYVQKEISPDVDYEKVALFVDLGRTPAGATVEITDIKLVEVVTPPNVWDPAKVSYTYWYSASDWSGALKPEISEIDGGYSVVIPEGIGGSEWMGQTHFTLDNPISTANKYDFKITLKSSEDCTVTVKVAKEGDDTNHALFYDGNVQLSADEPLTFSQKDLVPDVDYEKVALFVDLGRTPANATVEITNIILYEK